MTAWTMRPVAMSIARVEENQPLHTWTASIGEHRVEMRTTARGYYELTKRRHPHIKAMHTAYGNRKGNR